MLIHDQLKSYVQQHMPVSAEDWAIILPKFKPVFVPKNHYLVSSGQTCRHMFFINSGLFRVYLSDNPVDINRYFAVENTFFTTLTSFLTQNPSLENMQALEDGCVLKIHYESLELLYQQYPAWSNLFRQLYQVACMDMAKRIDVFITKSAEDRYNELLKSRPDLIRRVPQQHLASFLGVTPVTLSRIRGKIVRP